MRICVWPTFSFNMLRIRVRLGIYDIFLKNFWALRMHTNF